MANTQKIMTLSDTANLIARVHRNANGGARPEYDTVSGEYTNLRAYWDQHRDGKVYGVQFPKYTFSTSPEGVKTRDNAGLVAEISTNITAGRDDYATLNAFRVFDVNATVDDDGKPHVTAISGLDDRFANDGTNGDVWVMGCPCYYRVEETDTHYEFLWSDTHYDGYIPAPGVLLPSGDERDTMLYAKYMADVDEQYKPMSVSGRFPSIEFGSQNNIIDRAKLKGNGYAGRCSGDTFYVQMMLMLKYATKNSNVLGGCFEYNPQTKLTMAENSVTRVVIPTANAGSWEIGSTVNVGTDTERNNAGNYSAARFRIILSKDSVDGENTALNLDGDPFDTTTDCYVSSMPWKTGFTDKILGHDGRANEANPMRQPVRLQGIELFNGIFETAADLICNATKVTGDSGDVGHNELYRVFDIANASKDSVENYTKLGEYTPRDSDTNDTWQYSQDFILSNGVFIPQGFGATSTTGLCDGVYANPLTSQGLREVLFFGDLGSRADCGVWCVYLHDGLGGRWWHAGGRLSALGRTKA